jgi:hypothetical protein
MHRNYAAVLSAFALLGAGAGAGVALGGEVAGPPGSATNPPTKTTAAPEHSQSICSFNGLNDFVNGPKVFQTQTPHNQGEPGEAGADPAGSDTPGDPTCGGGSNPRLNG